MCKDKTNVPERYAYCAYLTVQLPYLLTLSLVDPLRKFIDSMPQCAGFEIKNRLVPFITLSHVA